MQRRIMLIEMSPSGGLFQFGFQLGSALARSGHDVRLVTGPEPELTSQEPGLTIADVLPTWHAGEKDAVTGLVRRLRRLWRAFRHVQALLLLLLLIRRDRPDVVLFHPLRFVHDAWFVRLVRLAHPAARRAIVLHEPRPLAEQGRAGSLYKQAPLTFLAQRGAIRALDTVLVLGEQSRRDTHQVWQPRGDVVVVPHGDEAVFRDAQSLEPVSRTRPLVLFFGIWTRHKGLDVLLDAFAAVVEQLPEARLLVAGAVTADVDLEQVRRRARAVPGVELRPGYVDMADVPDLFGQARLVVVPYLRAAQSGVVHLAQTFDRPVVASDVGDIPGVVPHDEAGLIVPPGDVAALADAMLALLRDPERAEALGAHGGTRLRGSSSWDTVASAVVRALGLPPTETEEAERA